MIRNHQIGLSCLLTAGGIVLLLVLQHQSGAKLEREALALREEVSDLPSLAAQIERLSNNVAEAEAARAAAAGQSNELQKLRAEAGALAAQAREVEMLKASNLLLRAQSLRKEMDTPKEAIASEEFPKESWAFAGYATSEAAFQSLSWAASKGDAKAYAAGISLSQQHALEEKLKDVPESETAAFLAEVGASLTNKVNGTTGYRILTKQVISPDETFLTIDVHNSGGDAKIWTMRMVKTDDVWRLAGPAKNTQH
jgi:hypothetical protein